MSSGKQSVSRKRKRRNQISVCGIRGPAFEMLQIPISHHKVRAIQRRHELSLMRH